MESIYSRLIGEKVKVGNLGVRFKDHMVWSARLQIEIEQVGVVKVLKKHNSLLLMTMKQLCLLFATVFPVPVCPTVLRLYKLSPYRSML